MIASQFDGIQDPDCCPGARDNVLLVCWVCGENVYTLDLCFKCFGLARTLVLIMGRFAGYRSTIDSHMIETSVVEVTR
jgi:hypothetical protein